MDSNSRGSGVKITHQNVSSAKAIEVVSSSEGADVISVTANSLTGRGMYIETAGLNTGSSLNINGGTSASTGSALAVSQNSDNHSLRNVMSIIQDSF